MTAKEAIQESAVTGKSVVLSFSVAAYSDLMVNAAYFTEYPRSNQIEFCGNELGKAWTVKLAMLDSVSELPIF